MTEQHRSARLLTLVAPIVETLVNGWLRLDPDIRAGLSGEAPSCIAVELTELSLSVYLVLDHGEIHVRSEPFGTPAVWIRGPTPSLFAMLLTDRIRSDVVIEGDADLAARLHHAVRGVDIDWEEQLSKVTGDAVAHEVGKSARVGLRWLRDVGESLRLDAKEYLTEESLMLPTRSEIETYMDGVDALRSDIDRLEAHIARLEAARQPQ